MHAFDRAAAYCPKTNPIQAHTSFVREHAGLQSDESPRSRLGDDVLAALHIIGNNRDKHGRYMLDLRKINIREAGLAGTDFSNVRMFSCLMERISFVGADLRYSRLDGCKLMEAWLEGADLRWATLRGADLRGASILGARVSATQLEHCNIDDTTALNDGLREEIQKLRSRNLSRDMG